MIKHGVRFTERFLPLDTTVTIVGELARDSVGAQRHQRHHQQQQQQQLTTSARTAKLPDAPTASSSSKADPHGQQRDVIVGESEDQGLGVQDVGRSSNGAGPGGRGRGAVEGRGKGEGGGGGVVADVVAVAAGEALAGQAAAAAVRMLPYALHMPQHGPFHVTTLTLPQLRSRLSNASRALTVRAGRDQEPVGWGPAAEGVGAGLWI